MVRFFFLGKPSIEIYKESLRNITDIDKSKILAIGDSLYHDIQGAINYEIDSLLITSKGIHKRDFDKKNPIWETEQNTLKKIEIKPSYICSELIF